MVGIWLGVLYHKAYKETRYKRCDEGSVLAIFYTYTFYVAVVYYATPFPLSYGIQLWNDMDGNSLLLTSVWLVVGRLVGKLVVVIYKASGIL